MAKTDENYEIKLKAGPVLITARIIFATLLIGAIVFFGISLISFPEPELTEEELAEQLYNSSGNVPEAVAYVKKQTRNRMFCLRYGTPNVITGASYITTGRGKYYVKVSFRSLDGETGSVCYNATNNTVTDVALYSQKLSEFAAGDFYSGQGEKNKEREKHFTEEEIKTIMEYREEVINGTEAVQ